MLPIIDSAIIRRQAEHHDVANDGSAPMEAVFFMPE
jgi:hypothetical protein